MPASRRSGIKGVSYKLRGKKNKIVVNFKEQNSSQTKNSLFTKPKGKPKPKSKSKKKSQKKKEKSKNDWFGIDSESSENKEICNMI